MRAAADRMGFDHSYLSRLEGGEFDAPRPEQLQTIARALGIPIENLYALAGYQASDTLPDFGSYLRAKYDLPDEAVERLDEYFQMLKERYVHPGAVVVIALGTIERFRQAVLAAACSGRLTAD